MIKGALIAIPKLSGPPSAASLVTLLAKGRVVLFQYNPETVTRSVNTRLYAEEGTTRYAGAPTESVDVDIELEATREMEKKKITLVGIRPQLAALELLTYPSLIDVAKNQLLLQLGKIEVVPIEAPLTLFVFGINQVIPVRLKSVTVTEQFFDDRLNPIRAKVSLKMDVVTYSDVLKDDPNFGTSLARQTVLELLAVAGRWPLG